ncbi:glycoside hydrolase [Streptomyces sp. NPDC056160]|uniref:glycoside hydrolase n=1 Tax=Streptomyces sp. NPDC056160 TaxID=3345731 RepID=UPI0035DDF8AF
MPRSGNFAAHEEPETGSGPAQRRARRSAGVARSHRPSWQRPARLSWAAGASDVTPPATTGPPSTSPSPRTPTRTPPPSRAYRPGSPACCRASSTTRRSPAHPDVRTDETTANGAGSYFLDVDAAGELFTDRSAAHPMTQAQDRENRLKRMAGLSADRKLVLGSENAGSWANGVLDFSHGSGTPVTGQLWQMERDRTTWGGYAPYNAPAFYFKPVHLRAALAKAMYAPGTGYRCTRPCSTTR